MLGKEEIEHRLEQLLTVSDGEEQLAKQAAGLEADTGFPDLLWFIEQTVIHGDQSVRYAAERISLYNPHEPKLNREQLIELTAQILACEGTEAEIDHKVNQLADNVPHPEVTDLIFWSDEGYSAEQIVDMALAYRPIIAPPAPDRV
ncbi:hypothetical protein [Paenibacillus sp. OSY-SE]|uniref:hypothetical protein n=1 Tax=Paenibacillus sp. OSY-SE TaxID=1196323 RepID=UPI0002E99D58|nr:hypothetical protein [Paenibacillus sp. OSY-SE]